MIAVDRFDSDGACLEENVIAANLKRVPLNGDCRHGVQQFVRQRLCDHHGMESGAMMPSLSNHGHRAAAALHRLVRKAVAAAVPILLAGIVMTSLFWIAKAYLHPDLRKAIVFSGFGLC